MSSLQQFFDQHKPKSTPGVSAIALAQVDHAFGTARLPRTLIALDVCCGAGKLTGALADRGFRALGLDISIRFIGREAGSGAAFAITDLSRGLPITAGSVDLICCIDSLQYFADPRATLHEMARVLQSGGTLILSTQNNSNPAGLKRWAIEHLTGRPWSPWLAHPIENHLTERQLRQLLAEAGFTIEYVRGLQFLTAWVSVLPRGVRNWSPWPGKPWRSLASLSQRISLFATIEESALARIAMITFVRARKR